MKSKRILLVLLAFAAVFAITGCEQPPSEPPPTMFLTHPLGTIGLGMDIDEVSEILGMDPDYFLEVEDVVLADYTYPNLVILYDDMTARAVLIRAFGPGSVFNGVTIGMGYDEALALSGEYAVESIVPRGGGRYAITLYFNANGDPVRQNDNRRSHAVTYEFYDGVVERLIIEIL